MAKTKNVLTKKHFTKNFEIERVSDEEISGRVFIQFTIYTHGHLKDVQIKAKQTVTELSKEIHRVITKLPIFLPGKHQGIPTPVKYSLPMNFSIE